MEARDLKKGMTLRSGGTIIEDAFCSVKCTRNQVQVGIEWNNGNRRYHIWNAKTIIKTKQL
jgi:hypothetical protein